jgi:hypothetical protein
MRGISRLLRSCIDLFRAVDGGDTLRARQLPAETHRYKKPSRGNRDETSPAYDENRD